MQPWENPSVEKKDPSLRPHVRAAACGRAVNRRGAGNKRISDKTGRKDAAPISGPRTPSVFFDRCFQPLPVSGPVF